ncbi:Subunit of the glycosylphosphatidylinositol transamidase complex-like protein [Marasmius crinis-equi]|uniref:Subunit of the glycosylphosphatidylinositol transamidase complex-like protein n=1 Tax=Marasmius crinis-equi TaxID=585013 RepID=A0ABR3FGA0_9AGAR
MRLPFHLFFTLVLLSCSSTTLTLGLETFKEDLSIRSLRDGKVAASFSFRTLLRDATPRDPRRLSVDDDDDISQHYTLFPLTLGQILRQYAITELHLTLNAGKWNYESWGAPEEPGVGTGAELWAWMADGGSMSVDHRWQGLRNALAGLFCASLGSLDEQRTTSPKLAFPPEGSLPDFGGLPYQIRHASHASEHVCTENLTPFLKLLPCKSSSGLASLLNPHRLFDADWHGMGVHVTWTPEGIEVRLSFQLVSDPLRSVGVQKQNWSLDTLFDRKIQASCPVAASSQISVGLPANGMYRIIPEPTKVEGEVARYQLGTSLAEPLNVGLEWASDFEYPSSMRDPALTPVSIHRTLQGPTQDRGRLRVTLKNNGPDDLKVLYLETMPWLLQFYLHTTAIHVDGVPRRDLISNVSYIPPVPHSQPATFESVLAVPGNSTVTYSVDVTKAFLRYTEHPPDAQRGWDLPPAVFVPLSDPDSPRRIYSPALLVDLATPDFSMPYNVIIFTCSVVAFIFGSTFNLLTRKFVVVQLQGPGEGRG